MMLWQNCDKNPPAMIENCKPQAFQVETRLIFVMCAYRQIKRRVEVAQCMYRKENILSQQTVLGDPK